MKFPKKPEHFRLIPALENIECRQKLTAPPTGRPGVAAGVTEVLLGASDKESPALMQPMPPGEVEVEDLGEEGSTFVHKVNPADWLRNTRGESS